MKKLDLKNLLANGLVQLAIAFIIGGLTFAHWHKSKGLQKGTTA